MKARFVLALAMILVLGVAGGASLAATVGDNATVVHGALVPFKAVIQTYPKVVAPPGDPLVLEIPGEGRANILGSCSFYSDSLVFSGSPYNHQTGDMTFTAANGSQLFGRFDGAAFFDPVQRTNNFWGTYLITGGTDRFAGATGGGNYWGTAQAAPPGQPGQGMLYLDGAMFASSPGGYPEPVQ